MLAHLAREAIRIHRVLAHHREIVERAVRERGAGGGEEQRQQQHARRRSRPQPRDGIGGDQPETHERHPEGRPRGHPYHLVAAGGERIGRSRQSERERRDPGERCEQTRRGARHEHRYGRYQQQQCLQSQDRPGGQGLQQPAGVAGQDAVRLEEHERQKSERGRAGGGQQHAERVEPRPCRRHGFSKPFARR